MGEKARNGGETLELRVSFADGTDWSYPLALDGREVSAVAAGGVAYAPARRPMAPAAMPPGGLVEHGELRCRACGWVTQAVAEYCDDWAEAMGTERPPAFCGMCGQPFDRAATVGWLYESLSGREAREYEKKM